MWPSTPEDRLHQWYQLRVDTEQGDLELALMTINNWWFRVPIQARYLDWDQHDKWPDPWQLLNDNAYCDIARPLGIMYTIMLLQRSDIGDLCMVRDQEDNLVLVNEGKYILNWAPGQLLNIGSSKINIKQSISSKLFDQYTR